MKFARNDTILFAIELTLAEEFDGVVNLATIRRLVESSYDDLAEHATTVMYLPVLVERFARQRLQALAHLEGHQQAERPVVLFLCVHNAGRSQMALGFFHQHAGERALAWSSGSQPAAAIHDVVVQAMGERGIDITHEFPKPWTDEVVQAADVVITMGCGDACPVLPGKRYEDWAIDDPAGRGLAEVRLIRDEIERRVLVLLDELAFAHH